MGRALTILITLWTLMCGANAKKEYAGYKVLKVQINSKEDAAKVQEIQLRHHLDSLNNPHVGGKVDLMTPPDKYRYLTDELESNHVPFVVSVEDLQEVVDQSPMAPPGDKKDPKVGHNMNWTHYHCVEDIYGYYDYLEEHYAYVTTEVIGKTYEGRDMRVVKICTNGCGKKPAMYIDAGIHAREWIAPATATYMLNELTVNLNFQDDKDLIDKLDWYFIAPLNPDGYEFSWTENRLWRKTRRPNNDSFCVGTDPNRNFDFHWGGEGASNYACLEDYHGGKPWSEIEIANIRDFLLSVKDQVKFVDSIHSYGQYILLPYGYTNELPDNNNDQLCIGARGREAMQAVHGTKYTMGNTFSTLYPASGVLIDWAHGVAEIPYAYILELRDKGKYHFLLPANQIIPTGQEVWAFHKSAARDMITLYGENRNGSVKALNCTAYLETSGCSSVGKNAPIIVLFLCLMALLNHGREE